MLEEASSLCTYKIIALIAELCADFSNNLENLHWDL
jgi:hypothetical protein